MKYSILAAAVLAASASAANAQQSIGSAAVEHIDFSGDFGSRRVSELNYSARLDRSTLVFDLAHGRRDYADEDFSAARGQATFYHDWSDRFFTRTSVAVANNSPVFPTHDISQEFNVKPTGNMVATASLRHIRYFGGRDALAWSAGGSYYFPGGFLNYRFSRFDVDDLGKTHGHVASVRINDRAGAGLTQLWVGAGTSLHEYQFLPALSEGKNRSVAIRRLQPVAGKLALDVNVGRSWYDTGELDYRGTTLRAGVTLLR